MIKLLVNTISIYQRFSVAIFAGACRYEITCSQYTKQAILDYGVWKGSLMGAKRIFNCR